MARSSWREAGEVALVHPLTRDTLRGTWATVLLPLADDESIDFGRLAAELTALAGAAPDGIYTNGTAGEFHTLDEEEYDRVTAVVAERCTAAGIPFQLGASHMSGQISLGRIRRSAAFEPSAIQVILPDWCGLSADEVLFAVERMAQVAGPVPLVLYNPPHAKTRLEPELFGRVATAFPQLAGIKVAGGDASWFARMRAAAPTLAIFVAGNRLASGLQHGARGSYSNVACLSPAGAVAWYQAMLAEPAAALRLEARVNAFLDRHVLPLQRAGYSNAALDKTLAAVGGWAPVGTRTRWPYRFVPQDVASALVPVARAELPELFADAPA
jgi:dihydrodipicolinate synthase/N-acetylneuraminate lyase